MPSAGELWQALEHGSNADQANADHRGHEPGAPPTHRCGRQVIRRLQGGQVTGALCLFRCFCLFRFRIAGVYRNGSQ